MKIPEINQRVKQVIDYYTNGVVKKFAENIGIKQQTVNRLFVIDKRTGKYPVATTDVLQKISEMYDVNSEWLLSGYGEMLPNGAAKKELLSTSKMVLGKRNEGIPLIPINAMAGYFAGEIQINATDCDYYVVPLFKEAEFLIPVKGSSMYPKYNSGDIVACKRVPLDTFFQWNKVYVLDTEQGALVKRIKKGETDDTITIISDNPKYEPFLLQRSKIYAIAIVVGVIRQE